MDQHEPRKNVLGGALETCSIAPRTGFFRDGCCRGSQLDPGAHIVCVEVNEAFLTFSAAHGNDLSTPRPEFDFAGLKPGDRWCVCAERWVQAMWTGFAAPIVLEATDEAMLEHVELDVLQAYATAARPTGSTE